MHHNKVLRDQTTHIPGGSESHYEWVVDDPGRPTRRFVMLTSRVDTADSYTLDTQMQVFTGDNPAAECSRHVVFGVKGEVTGACEKQVRHDRVVLTITAPDGLTTRQELTVPVRLGLNLQGQTVSSLLESAAKPAWWPSPSCSINRS